MQIAQTPAQVFIIEEGDQVTFESQGKLYEKVTILGIDSDANAFVFSSATTPTKPKSLTLPGVNFLQQLDLANFFNPAPDPKKYIVSTFR